MEEPDFLTSAFIYLLAAVVAVPLFKRLGLGSILGYLVAGMVIGPWGIGVIRDVNAILQFSEFGIAMLMFLIGLELKPSTLWQLRRRLLGLGTMQVGISTLIIGLLVYMSGVSIGMSLAVGIGLALSSTPIALQTLEERGQSKTDVGEATFAVLLFQDLSIIPVLAFVPILGAGAGAANFILETELKILAVLAFFVFSSRFLLRPLFRYIAMTGLREVFTSFSLFLVVGSGLLTELAGVSMALGTFMAGVLLADSEYRHELELNIEPFKGLLMGLFFIAVGMTVDIGLFIADPIEILMLVGALMAVKGLVLLAIARSAGFTLNDQIFFALLIAPAGEFAFVMISLLTSAAMMPAAVAAKLLVVASVSMLLAPLTIFVRDLVTRHMTSLEDHESDVEADEGHVIIAGFGRFGQIIGRLMLSLKIPTVIVDSNPNHIENLSKFGYKVFYGDVTRLDLLEAAGAKDARLLVLAMDDPNAVLKAAKIASKHFPKLTKLARASTRGDVMNLKDAGVDHVRREAFASSLEIGEMALRELGYPAHLAHRTAGRFRRYDELAIETVAEFRDDEAAIIDFAKRSRKQLEDLMDHDAASNLNEDKGW
ncbi:MAG: cation:proton antiporter [Kordiimonadaceae bacterium]|nr:cation:proton antiporter [Kordiimonadaceae bacterium]MBO6568857.1 cation:proton antiporter [Kordiimonadaceae bacterium]MBO6965168.1 cation:proton antiporter [Kordiimonadaceae bacterium]